MTPPTGRRRYSLRELHRAVQPGWKAATAAGLSAANAKESGPAIDGFGNRQHDGRLVLLFRCLDSPSRDRLGHLCA